MKTDEYMCLHSFRMILISRSCAWTLVLIHWITWHMLCRSMEFDLVQVGRYTSYTRMIICDYKFIRNRSALLRLYGQAETSHHRFDVSSLIKKNLLKNFHTGLFDNSIIIKIVLILLLLYVAQRCWLRKINCSCHGRGRVSQAKFNWIDLIK